MATPVLAPTPPAPSSIGGAFTADGQAAAQLFHLQSAVPPHAGTGLAPAIALVLLGAAIAWPIRTALLRALSRLLSRRDPQARFHIEAKAALTVILSTLLVGVGAEIALLGIKARYELIAPFQSLAATVVAGFGVAGLGWGLGRALRSPDDPGQRPFTLPDGLDRAAGLYPAIGGILLGCVGFVQRAATIIHASTLSWGIAQGLLLALEMLFLIRFLLALARARNPEDGGLPGSGRMALSLGGLAWAVLIVAIGAILFGHVRFSVMLVQELIWAALIIMTALLIGGFLEALLAVLLSDERGAGEFAVQIVGVGSRRVAQARILLSAAALVLVWLVALSLILAPLGGAGISLVDQVRPALVFQELRRLHISPRAIAVAIFLLVAGVVLTRLIRRWLDRRFLPATDLDQGVRASILTGVSYAGVLIAILAASNALGVALDKITLIASALSVGIGFGLQSIIQNFVSGVILLIERPIKMGDWVSAAGAEGQVRRIRVRATELAMADGSVAIVPNSSFISAAVQNRTGAGLAGRVEITAKLTGCDGPAQAQETIRAIIADAKTAAGADPSILLTDVSDGTYGFAIQLQQSDGKRLADFKSRVLFALADGAARRGHKITLS